MSIDNDQEASQITYCLDKASLDEKNVQMFGLGGETFHISLLTIDAGVLVVKETSGDKHIGVDFRGRTVIRFNNQTKWKCEMDICRNRRVVRQLQDAWEAELILECECVDPGRQLFNSMTSIG